jgi:Uma2 family endonuclease
MSTAIQTQKQAKASDGSVSVLEGDEPLYEVVDGERVELPPMSTLSCGIASELGQEMGPYAKSHKLGRVFNEALFLLPLKTGDRQRRPDLAFVSFSKWPADRALPNTDPWPVVPELAIEVISPNDLYNEILAKLRDYFQAGVQLVWVVEPSERQVSVYTSPTDHRILTEEHVLDGGTVLPGFKLPVVSLFQPAGAGQ